MTVVIIFMRLDKIHNLSGQVKKVARVSKQDILLYMYYLSTCNKDANEQYDLRLCCSHRLLDMFAHDGVRRKITSS